MGMEQAVEKLGPLAIAFVFVGIVIAFGAVILGEMSELDAIETTDGDSTPEQIIDSALDALDTFGSFLGVIAIVALAAIIFVLLKVFGGMGRSGSMV